MKNVIILSMLPFLFACGTNQFAKRKFTKGVYVEKRSHSKPKNSKPKKQKHRISKNKSIKQNDLAIKTKNTKIEAISRNNPTKNDRSKLIPKNDLIDNSEILIDNHFDDSKVLIQDENAQIDLNLNETQKNELEYQKIKKQTKIHSSAGESVSLLGLVKGIKRKTEEKSNNEEDSKPKKKSFFGLISFILCMLGVAATICLFFLPFVFLIPLTIIFFLFSLVFGIISIVQNKKGKSEKWDKTLGITGLSISSFVILLAIVLLIVFFLTF